MEDITSEAQLWCDHEIVTQRRLKETADEEVDEWRCDECGHSFVPMQGVIEMKEVIHDSLLVLGRVVKNL